MDEDCCSDSTVISGPPSEFTLPTWRSLITSFVVTFDIMARGCDSSIQLYYLPHCTLTAPSIQLYYLALSALERQINAQYTTLFLRPTAIFTIPPYELGCASIQLYSSCTGVIGDHTARQNWSPHGSSKVPDVCSTVVVWVYTVDIREVVGSSPIPPTCGASILRRFLFEAK